MRPTTIKTIRQSLQLTAAELARRNKEQAPAYPGTGLTLREASARIGVSMQTWHRWEKGKTVPKSKEILIKMIAGVS